jgi:hypothetical protein
LAPGERREKGGYVRHQWFYHNLIVAILLAGATLLGCGTTIPVTTASGDGLTEDYAVYGALIQDRFIDHNGWSLVVMQGSTLVADQDPDWHHFILSECLDAIKRSWPKLGDDILGDFVAKTKTSLTLERRFNLSVGYTFVSKEEASSFWPGGTQYETLSKKYPGSLGSVCFSRIGFNKAKDTAVLYLDYHTGHVVLLKKTAGIWTVQGDVELWTA